MCTIRVSAERRRKLLGGFLRAARAQQNLAEQFVRGLDLCGRARRQWHRFLQRSGVLHRVKRVVNVPLYEIEQGGKFQLLNLCHHDYLRDEWFFSAGLLLTNGGKFGYILLCVRRALDG